MTRFPHKQTRRRLTGAGKNKDLFSIFTSRLDTAWTLPFGRSLYVPTSADGSTVPIPSCHPGRPSSPDSLLRQPAAVLDSQLCRADPRPEQLHVTAEVGDGVSGQVLTERQPTHLEAEHGGDHLQLAQRQVRGGQLQQVGVPLLVGPGGGCEVADGDKVQRKRNAATADCGYPPGRGLRFILSLDGGHT